VYFVLAGLAIASIASTLWLTYSYVGSHSDLVARSREWANRMDAYNHLGELAAAVDAPGNDVFQSRDVAAERARAARALGQFQSELTTQHFALDRSHATGIPGLQALLDTVGAEIDSVYSLGLQTLTAFQARGPGVAGAHMAVMDRHFMRAIMALGRMRGSVRTEREALLARQAAVLARIQRLERVIAALVVLLLVGAGWYGVRITRELQRHQAEREAFLRERYRSLVELAPDAIVTLSPEGVFTSLNPAFERLTGWPVAEWLGRRFQDIVHPGDLPRSSEAFTRTLSDDLPQRLENRVRTRAGGYLHIENIITREIVDGRVIGLLGIARDVTARRRAEAALRESEERLRAVVAGAPIILFAYDRDGTVILSEGKALSAIGRQPGESVGRSVYELYADNLPVMENARRALAGEPVYNVTEVRGRTLETWISPVRGPDGAVSGALGVSTDVTDRRRAELELAKSEEKFSKAFRSSPNASLITRLRDGLLVDVNDAFCSVTGYDRDEVLGRTTGERIWPDPEQRKAFVRALEQDGRIKGMELKMRTKAGPVLDILAFIEVIELNGEPHTIGEVMDISERKRAAEALRESEERFRRLVEELGVGVAVVDRECRVRLINPAALRMLGTTEDRAKRDGLYDLDLEFVRENGSPLPHDERPLPLAAATKRPVRDAVVGFRGPRRTDWTWLRMDVEPQLADDGAIRQMIVTFADITERRRAEAELQALLSAMSDLIIVLDADGRYVKIAPTNPTLLYAPAKDLVGRTLHEVFPRSDADEFLEHIRRCLAEQRTHFFEYKLAIGDGDVWFSAAVSPLGDRSVVWVARDVTERRRLQDAVMASAVDWTLTFDAVQSPMIVLSGDGRVRRLNAAARDLAGLTSYNDAVGRVLLELSANEPWRGMADLATRVHRAHASSGTQVFEPMRQRTWDLTASPVTVPGEEDRVILLARDVTDVVQLQESLRRTETMSTLGAVVAGVAHEVRNPLFAISATVDAFEARFGAQEHTKYTKTLRQEVSRLSELMHELLEYGKPPRLELALVPLGPVVQRAIERTAGAARDAKVRLIPDLPDDLPVPRQDPSRMLQVFENLILNAIQHTPAGGAVTVSGTALRGQEDTWVSVTVADSGTGIRQEDLPHLFQPFFTRRRGGTGLGLSIVQRIVEQHNGEITVKNRLEGGAMVTVQLAAAAPAPATAVGPIGAEPQDSRR
jgi:PAS domain S-box-containing protein